MIELGMSFWAWMETSLPPFLSLLQQDTVVMTVLKTSGTCRELPLQPPNTAKTKSQVMRSVGEAVARLGCCRWDAKWYSHSGKQSGSLKRFHTQSYRLIEHLSSQISTQEK